MRRYLNAHEALVRARLAQGEDREALARYHLTRVEFLQHERLVHLLVMLFVGLCVLVMFLALILEPSVPMALLLLLFVGLLIPYVLHYYLLENGVQRWYRLADEIEANTDTGAGTSDAQ
ncbi:MAG: hypothetical protein EG823_04160 [Actinobacteria bacterium]|nr:hypothetical protein [Actinomycetota bacterium]